MYDVIVIGGGPGGYLAAERLAHRGKKVLVIEKQYMGGTCLNVGCIPTKTLLNSAKQYLHAKEADQFGVHADNVSFNMTEMMSWKEQVVKTLRNGVAASVKKCGAEILSETLASNNKICPSCGGKQPCAHIRDNRRGMLICSYECGIITYIIQDVSFTN